MPSKEALFNELNEMQREAVEYNAGPMLVIAGAGSGKTRMLTYKIAYLISSGVEPWNILALTFTNKAAREMKERVGQLVGEKLSRYINMGTFHSIFARILRQEAPLLGFTPQYTIYDETDSKSLVKAIIKEMGLDDKTYKPSAVCKRISLAKNNMIDHERYASDAALYERDRQARVPMIGKIFSVYEQRCRAANAIDFDDLLLLTHKLFFFNDNIRRKWEERFQHILVDEYQDTNKVQQMILEQLTRESQHICVVGDDAQSIYAFRGANIDNILSFSQVYPSAKMFKLERNYRSTKHIVKAANSLISHNQRQISKDVFSENESGERLALKQAFSDTEEALIVCNEIRRIRRREGADYSDFAVLYRTNAQSRSFEEAFLKQDIPYKIYGGLSFYQRKEIKDIVAYFRLVVNPNDEEAFRRIVNYPTRGIGQTTIAKIADVATRSGVSFWQVCLTPDNYDLGINAGTKKKIADFVALISSFQERLNDSDAYALGHDVIRKSGIYADIFDSSDVEDIARQENINEFEGALHDFVEERQEEDRADEASLGHFLEEVSLESSDDREGDDDRGKVSLMTVHAAKGLEFPTVFVVGLEENIFPSAIATSSVRELEEERRLLYVAITRAQKRCILTFAKNRWRYGKMEFFAPSRFIHDLDPRYLDVEKTGAKPERKSIFDVQERGSRFKPINTFSLTSHKSSDAAHEIKPNLSVGTTIEHERFGRGKVVSVEGSGAETKATVEFTNVGRKVLLLKFAKYSILA